MRKEILVVEDLEVRFKNKKKELTVVDHISFSVKEGETLGIVGESGCGKSVTSLAIMGLLPAKNARISNGNIRFYEQNLVELTNRNMQKIRGKEIGMIFQEPMTSLNPAYTIGNQLGETLRIHLQLSKEEIQKRVLELLEMVEIPRANEVAKEYPHQLSGGMRQRVMIAMALSCSPKLIIADEPTTALDVTIQAQILELMKRLRKEQQTSTILISHDLGVIAEMCDRVIVMYAGKIIEQGTAVEIFTNPSHPYTEGLLKSIPRLREKKERLYTIEGNVPTPDQMPNGCRFAPRCEKATSICWDQEPGKNDFSETHSTHCWLHAKELVSV